MLDEEANQHCTLIFGLLVNRVLDNKHAVDGGRA